MSICKQCGINPTSGDLCMACVTQNINDEGKMRFLIYQGHTRHCAERQVWGDGECSCELEKHYDPYWWKKMQFKVPFTTA